MTSADSGPLQIRFAGDRGQSRWEASIDNSENRGGGQRPAKSVLLVAANPALSPVTGWPVGFWWAELTHPYLIFRDAGYDLTIASPQGGALRADAYSDPEDESGYAADDLISLGFKHSPGHADMLTATPAIADLDIDGFDALFVAGGQSPMITMIDDDALHRRVTAFYESGRVTALVCHATCILLKARLPNGELLCRGKTWTGFANAEEDLADHATGRRIQPFRIEDRARRIADTNFITAGAFQPFAVRDGHLITGQQQHSGAEAARLVVQALGA